MAQEDKHLALALQGGGAHGAFTWGVLDRLLDEKNLNLDGFVGISAGAMNATVLAYGLHAGGKSLAKELLEEFWKKASSYSFLSPLRPSWYDLAFGKYGNMDYSPGYMITEITSRFLSPYQVGNGDYNPLREILKELVDFERLKKCQTTQLFVCATHVQKGRAKIFGLSDISADAVLASACLPQLFKAVTINGEDYWDGGYMGNPPIFPLIDNTSVSDILLVQVNPVNIPETPKTAEEIKDRVHELSLNSSLMLEMQKITFVNQMLGEGINFQDKFRKIYVHNINPEKDIWDLNVSSKLNATWEFLLHLKKLGQKYADGWLEENYDKIGKESSCDIQKEFL